MFKQAILITAYKNYNHLEEIIAFFDENFEIYIHIDKKSKISKDELSLLLNNEIVKLVSQKYKVNWGSFNHLKSILYLSNEALKNNHNKYFHLISGHDYPTKSIEEFDYFIKNAEKDHLDCFDMSFTGWGINGGYDRLEHYNFYDLFNWKIDFQKKIIKKLLKWQKQIGFKRRISIDMPKMYGGSTWWSLSRISLEYVIEFSKNNPSFFKRFRYTFCPEEFYFQTVLINSKLKSKIVNSNLRYIDWSNRNGNNPSILDESDFHEIEVSKSFFARRFEYPVSMKLLQKIKNNFS